MLAEVPGANGEARQVLGATRFMTFMSLDETSRKCEIHEYIFIKFMLLLEGSNFKLSFKPASSGSVRGLLRDPALSSRPLLLTRPHLHAHDAVVRSRFRATCVLGACRNAACPSDAHSAGSEAWANAFCCWCHEASRRRGGSWNTASGREVAR